MRLVLVLLIIILIGCKSSNTASFFSLKEQSFAKVGDKVSFYGEHVGTISELILDKDLGLGYKVDWEEDISFKKGMCFQIIECSTNVCNSFIELIPIRLEQGVFEECYDRVRFGVSTVKNSIFLRRSKSFNILIDTLSQRNDVYLLKGEVKSDWENSPVLGINIK